MKPAVFVVLVVLGTAFGLETLRGASDTSSQAAPSPVSVNALVKQFDQLVFLGQERNRVSRWYGPINLVLDTSSESDRALRFSVDLLARELQRSTGFVAVSVFDRDVQSAENAIRLLVGGQKAARAVGKHVNMTEHHHCRMIRARNRFDNRPSGGTLALTGVFANEFLSRCLIWGAAGVLGLQPPACHVGASIFCDTNGDNYVQSVDLLMLEALFHPAIEQGMTRAEALPLVRRFFEERLPALHQRGKDVPLNRAVGPA